MTPEELTPEMTAWVNETAQAIIVDTFSGPQPNLYQVAERALRLALTNGLRAKAELEAARQREERLREALTTISRGIWTASNSIDTITWIARKAIAATKEQP